MLLGATLCSTSPAWPSSFQYPRVDRLVVGGMHDLADARAILQFQYPRVDRLVVGAEHQFPRLKASNVSVSSCGSTCCWGNSIVMMIEVADSFSILVWIDLLLGAGRPVRPQQVLAVSVSSCGSTCCRGNMEAAYDAALIGFSILVWIDLLLGNPGCKVMQVCPLFQYPRVDRLVVGEPFNVGGQRADAVSVSSCGSTCCWGTHRLAAAVHKERFSILVWIDLLSGHHLRPHGRGDLSFQYPRVDRLVVGALWRGRLRSWCSVSVSSCGSTCCRGPPSEPP